MSHCFHCDEVISIVHYNDSDTALTEPFCCLGCLTVFNVINGKGLEEYYNIKKNAAIFKRRAPVDAKQRQFDYLNQSDFLSEYSYKNQHAYDSMEFYLEGIHCLACLWLIEKLPEYLEDVATCRLDMKKSVVIVSLKPHGLFSNVARELNNLGYKPHPLKRNQSTHDLKNIDTRKMLLKIGIAGAGTGNIMLYAVSNYAGADAYFAQIFNALSIAFAIPVIFYSATPFYINAWNAIKNRTLSIDIPITIALLMGAAMGIYNHLVGINENFFDSLTALVFLLLLSRYFLNLIQDEGLAVNDLNYFYEGNSVLKQTSENQFSEIHPQFLKVDDIIKISANEMIPADGIILEGESLINSSLLTGESRPVNVSPDSHVFSGTVNLTNPILVNVKSTKSDSRIGKILKEVENGWTQKSHIVDLTNKISKYFVAIVFLLACTLYFVLFSQGKTREAFERSLTLLIVTCPCALAIATPLALTRTLSRASKMGIIIKNNEVIEKLTSIDKVFLDKTGTLTYGILKINEINTIKETSIPLLDIVNSLEKHSVHPIALSLKEYALKKGAKVFHPVNNYKEIMGSGVSGEIGRHFYEIIDRKIYEDKTCVAEFSFSDQLRDDTKSSIADLAMLGMETYIISGDQKVSAESIGLEAGIKKENVFSELIPEKKASLIELNPRALMAGDGANDAMALSRSFVSVAVLGSLDISLKASDIYLTTPGISQLSNVIIIAKETMKVVKRNLVLSLLYNSISVYAVFAGSISPLVAAIIMPLSSLTVLISTMIGTKKLNACFKQGAA